MSGKAGKMEKQIIAAQNKKVETVEKHFAIHVDIAGHGKMVHYMTLTGVPKDLPPETQPTLKLSVEKQFIGALNSMLYISFFHEDKTAKDEAATIINLSKADWIKVISIEEI